MMVWEVGEAVGSSPAGREPQPAGCGCAVLAKPREPSPQQTLTSFSKFMSFQSVMNCNAKSSGVLSNWWSGFADSFSAVY